MSTPFLIADAAEVAVMSPLAEAAFGSYDLQVPEGIDIEDIHDFEAPGNELGYVARLSPQRATGIARRFIRADVSVTAKDDTDPDVIPESDVDRVLSEAESRVESEFFLESDITKAGLGAWVPYADFNVGDIVNVRIFDIWVKLPVTRIEPIISEGDIVDWRVHVGGQLLSDDQAREVENATIQKELIQDRRDLAGIDAKATKAVKDSSEAKDTADSAKTTADEAKQATADNRTYIDEQLDLAGAAVEQGREYLRQMEEHVTAGNIAAGRAEDLASQAAAAAAEAVSILDQLDPLRDDVTAAHAEVVRLHDEASQFTAQAANHVQQASQHAADAVASASSASQHAADGKSYAEQALAHEAEGRRQAGLAAGSASAALQNANRAQQIVDDANGLLSQVEGYSQEAKDALSDAEALLGNVDGSGKSLGQVLLDVANLHQETLTAHDDILDLHGEVLEKHGEAINYVAAAAAQAGTAAMHASMAAQEALDVATNAARAASSASDAADDAGKAASSAGKAADEAAAAAENNRQAIGKLQEADGKLQEADQKLQAQIDILEESQRVLAHAVSLLSAGVAQAAAAARNAGKAAKSAGDAAGSALDAAASNSKAIAILNYERMRIAVRMSVQHDPAGNNTPPGITHMEYYGTSSQNEFLNITRSNGVRTSTLQTTSPSGPVYRNFEYWDFDINLLGNWSGVISWEAADGAIQDSDFRVSTVNVKNGEMAGARAYLNDPSNTNTTLRQVAQNALKRIAVPTTGGVVVVKVHPEYEEGKTNLGPYMS